MDPSEFWTQWCLTLNKQEALRSINGWRGWTGYLLVTDLLKGYWRPKQSWSYGCWIFTTTYAISAYHH